MRVCFRNGEFMGRLTRFFDFDWRSPMALLVAFLTVNQLFFRAAACLTRPDSSFFSYCYVPRNALLLRGGDDSWRPMSAAIEKLAAEPETPLYSTLVFEEGTKFQYPPMSLPPYQAIRTGLESAAIDPNHGFATIGVLCAIGIGLISAWILSRGLKQPFNVLTVAAGLLAAFTFYPLTRGIEIGQIQLWLNFAFALSLYAAMSGRMRMSGALIGIMCLFKPHYGLFVLWAAWKREVGFIVALIAAGGAASLVSLAMYGFHQHFDYLNALSYLSRHGEAYFANQSVNGILNRWYSLADPALYNNLVFEHNRFPPFTPLVYGITMVATVTFVITALVTARRDMALSFAIMMMSITMASPIAWEHHYGMVIPMYALAVVALKDRRNALIWLAASIVLMSHPWFVTNFLATTPLNIVQSYLFAGAMILLVLLHWAAAGFPARPWVSAVTSPIKNARQWMQARRT